MISTRKLLVWSALTLVVSSTSDAQVRTVSTTQSQTQRGKFVDGLLRNLVDSTQLDFNSRTPLQPVPPANATPEVQQVQRSVKAFADGAARLITALRYEERYSPNVRGMLGDALRVKANADVLTQRVLGIADPKQLSNEYAALDQQWRLLSHRLRQEANISSQVLQWVSSMDQSNQALEDLLKLDPQIERNELAHHFAVLASDYEHLAEDIRIDLWGNPQQQSLVTRTSNLRARADQLRSAVLSRYPYEDIVRYYKQLNDAWLPLKRDLRAVDNRYVQRNVDRISEGNDHLGELLLLPPVVDGRDILYLADALKRNVDSVASQISLQTLIALPNSADIFARAREFYVLCEGFRQTVATQSELDNVRWDFRELDVSWNELRTVLLPLNDPATSQQVALIDQSVMGLRETLSLRASVDQNEAMQLALSLDNMTDLLAYDINRFVGQSNQYSASFRNDTVLVSQNLRKAARAFYESVSRNTEESQLRLTAQQLASEWSRLQQYIARIPANDRAQLVRTVEHIAPAIAKLQVIYSY